MTTHIDEHLFRINMKYITNQLKEKLMVPGIIFLYLLIFVPVVLSECRQYSDSDIAVRVSHNEYRVRNQIIYLNSQKQEVPVRLKPSGLDNPKDFITVNHIIMTSSLIGFLVMVMIVSMVNNLVFEGLLYYEKYDDLYFYRNDGRFFSRASIYLNMGIEIE